MPKSCSGPGCTSNKVINTDLRFSHTTKPNPKTVPHRRVHWLASSYIREAASGSTVGLFITCSKRFITAQNVLQISLFLRLKKHAVLLIVSVSLIQMLTFLLAVLNK